MKKKLILLLLSLCTIAISVAPTSGAVAYAADTGVNVTAKSAYMLDYDTGTVMFAQNENEILPIASMTKIMTALLTFEAIEGGKLAYADEITVSENAASMGGSQVFLDANSVHTVENLLKCVIVASANDASVALAEAVSGSESAFTNEMNKRSKALNLTNTNFSNCTGLPAVNAYSSAKDVSLMLKELLRHEKYFEFSKIWLEDYVHPDGRTTTITNTNKLVRFYKGCDAGKTGFTSEAKFCLSASAKRGDMRVICTVIGEENGKKRFKDVSDLLNYSFATFENKVMIGKGEPVDNTVEVVRGKKSTLIITPDENVTSFSKKGDNGNAELVYELPDKIKAPVVQGQSVGTVKVVKDGIVVKEIKLVAAENIDKANIFDSIKKIFSNW